MHLEESRTIACSAPDIFRFLLDFDNHPKWVEGLERIAARAKTIRKGSVFSFVYKGRHGRVEQRGKVLECIHGERLAVMTSDGEHADTEVAIELEADGDATLLTFSLDVHYQTLAARAMAIAAKPLVRRWLHSQLGTLQEVLEAPAAASKPKPKPKPKPKRRRTKRAS